MIIKKEKKGFLSGFSYWSLAHQCFLTNNNMFNKKKTITIISIINADIKGSIILACNEKYAIKGTIISKIKNTIIHEACHRPFLPGLVPNNISPISAPNLKNHGYNANIIILKNKYNGWSVSPAKSLNCIFNKFRNQGCADENMNSVLVALGYN